MKRNLRRNGYTLVELAVVLTLVWILAAMMFPFLQEHKNKRQTFVCQSNLKQLGFAVQQYAQDYQNRFPLVKVNDVTSSVSPFARPFGWADALYPYTKSVQLLQCPGDDKASNPDATGHGFSDYWYNANLNGLSSKSVASPLSNFLIGDYRESRVEENQSERAVMNARFQMKTMPLDWLTEDVSRKWRHRFNNYLFADGHVAGYRTGYHDMTVH